jgi:hypothetical protein
MKTTLLGNFILSPLIALLCTGCVGYAYDIPHTVEVTNPVPNLEDQDDDWGTNRWACQSVSYPIKPISKERFRGVWGDPKEIVKTSGGEVWVYQESGRWCGIWLAIIIPIPLVLPVCETFDEVTFEDDYAVKSYSRRYSRSMAGVMFDPKILFFPIPLNDQPGAITESHSRKRVWPEKKVPTSCQ